MAKKRRVYTPWEPTAAYNIRGLRGHVDLKMPDGHKTAFGPDTWFVPRSEEEEEILEHEYLHQNPPHFEVRKCEVAWDDDRGVFVPVKPDDSTTEDAEVM